MLKEELKNVRIQLLDKDAQNEFRADYRQTEIEVQKNIAVYLSALVVATGWIFGPQSKPIEQLFLGNESANLFGLILLIAINAIFASFLAYKSIQIHEIMQFVITLSPQDSALAYWEAWRRSRAKSLSKGFTRILYIATISLVPITVSGILIGATARYTLQKPKKIVEQIQQMETGAALADRNSSVRFPDLSGTKSGPKSPDVVPKAKSTAESDDSSQELMDRVKFRLSLANGCLSVVGLFHLIPLWFLWVTWRKADSKWEEIRNIKNLPNFNCEIVLEDGPP
jgi:hypothetical protein